MRRTAFVKAVLRPLQKDETCDYAGVLFQE